MSLKEVEPISVYVLKAMLCGSRVTCDPAPTDTDQDVIVLVEYIQASACKIMPPEHFKAIKKYADMESLLVMDGWVCGGSGDQDDEFESWTKDDLNLILTSDIEFYNRFVSATTVCAHLNVLDKEDRKKVFRSVLYTENAYHPEEDGKEFMGGFF